MLSTISAFLSGVVFALQILCFLSFISYCVSEALIAKGVDVWGWCFSNVLQLLLRHRILDTTEEPIAISTNQKKNYPSSIREEVQNLVFTRDAFETAEWLNALLYEVFCTRKSREILDADQEELLLAIARWSRTMIESRLQDYQRESWLFLSSLNLDSFSLGDRLPLIQKIRLAMKSPTSMAAVVDLSYSGGIEVGLKGAMTMNIRDFSAAMTFRPSQFKFVLKMDSSPTPRISVMLSDLPDHDMQVEMRSQQLQRVSQLLNLLIGNFVRLRICYPNYMTVLFRTDRPYYQIATSKQYQSQLRVRIVSINLNPNHSGLLVDSENHIPEETKITTAVSFGSVTYRSNVLSMFDSSRLNSIHTFNIFNGLDSTPDRVNIALYQVLGSGLNRNSVSSLSTTSLSMSASNENIRSLNQLGRVEILYSSIPAGLLDVRTLPLSNDPDSTIVVEMYLHHIEENGSEDANWIFWNSPKPKIKVQSDFSQGQSARSLEQVNWNTIKFIISKLSSSTSDGFGEEDAIVNSDSDYEIVETFEFMKEKGQNSLLLDFINEKLEAAILRLKGRVLKIPSNEDLFTCIESDPIKLQIENCVAILKAMKLEITDFSDRYNLSRPALSELALSAHNDRLAIVLAPIVKCFIPSVIKMLVNLPSLQPESECSIRSEPLKKLFEDLEAIWIRSKLKPDLLSKNALLNVGSSVVSSDVESELRLENIESLNDQSPREFSCFFGLQPIKLTVDEKDGITIAIVDTVDTRKPEFDLEGVFHSPMSELKNIDLSSVTLLENDQIITSHWETFLIEKDGLLCFVPFGGNHYFPQKIYSISNDVDSIELFKEKGAFNLGFNANLTEIEALKHANNGLLRLGLDCGSDKIDLLGESRSCDNWFLILSSMIHSKTNPTTSKKTFAWSDVSKVWLIPLNIPASSTPFALAITASSSTFIFANFFIDGDIYQAYCLLKTLHFASKRSNSIGNWNSSSMASLTISTPNSSSSFQNSPKSNKSQSASLKDPFLNRSKYDRLGFNSDSSSSESSGNLKMTQIDSLHPPQSIPSWACSESKVISCTMDSLPAGHLFLFNPDFLYYCTELPRRYAVIPCSSIKDVVKVSSSTWLSNEPGPALLLQFKQSQQASLKIWNFHDHSDLEVLFCSLLGI